MPYARTLLVLIAGATGAGMAASLLAGAPLLALLLLGLGGPQFVLVHAFHTGTLDRLHTPINHG